MLKKIIVLCALAVFFVGCGGTDSNNGGDTTTQTSLKVKNSSTSAVDVWLTLGQVDGFVTDVNGIFGITTSGLQGKFTLQVGSELTYTPTKGISGNLSFGTPPINCPTSTFTNGVNIFEFCLNNKAQAGTPQETIDISAVAGVNSNLKCTLSGGGAWNAGSAHTGITTFENAALNSNTGLIGVFPSGADNCTSSDAPPVCVAPDLPHQPYETPQSEPICNIQRDATSAGGTVQIEFIGAL
ncbi:MAG: hypothetical protein WCQ53_02385 [bacterium]